jgi:ATP-dependent DNA helicase RecG
MTAGLGADEGHHLDRKSLRYVDGRRADFAALAQDCVAFANAAGGRIVLGIEDDADEPPPGQRIDPALVDRVRKRVGELTVGVQVHPEVETAANGGEVLVVHVPRAQGVASTNDGRYFLRVGDQSQPVVGDDVLRLATERPQAPWETLTGLQIPRAGADPGKSAALFQGLRASDRVKASVKEKSDHELFDHYGLAEGPWLTNLGVLLVGTAAHRARLGSASVIQAIKYDADRVKVDKYVWDDHALSPVELVDAVWEAVPDFRERYEVPDGLFRAVVPAYEEVVVRELLVNALVHRPYTQRGDIFLNLHPDRLEVVNPGRLPLGVTPSNILHSSRRRNDGLARVFHDLTLMEREGSGFDTLFERLLATGRAAPVASEGIDSVHVIVQRQVVHPGVVRLITEADQRHRLTQRERITLGLLAQTEGCTSVQLAERLGLGETSQLRPWLGGLLDRGLVAQTGRTKGTSYFVPPELVRASGLEGRTTLKRVQPHRLRALILEDLERYPGSSSAEVHERVGPEIPVRAFKSALHELVNDRQITYEGERRWRRYRVAASIERGDFDVR